jgi:hypothetical protein
MTTFNYGATCRRCSDHKRAADLRGRPSDVRCVHCPPRGRALDPVHLGVIGGPMRWGFGKGRVSPALFFSDGATAGAAELDAIRRLG